jgi:indolepyruvate ferredoxin oxidoreductase beta subunit
MPEITNVAIVGVGGQGILLASDVLAQAALCAGYDVKKNELHGMAQRGGSVVSEVRFGPKVHSPVIPDGETDVLVAMELLEALRSIHTLRSGGVVLSDDLRIRPSVRPPGAPGYPEEIAERLRASSRALLLPATQLAAQAGNRRAANTVLLGALSHYLSLPAEAWSRALQLSLRPSLLEVNLKAFALGSEAAAAALSGAA